jgi:hypothetical protein
MTGRGTLPPGSDGDRDALPLASPTGLGITATTTAAGPTVVGWRFTTLALRGMNRAERRKPLTHQPFAEFTRHRLSERAVCNRRPYAGLSWSPYSTQPHDAPDPHCQCGYRVVEDLDELQGYLDLIDSGQTAGMLESLAVYRVEGFGRVLPGCAPLSDDPPSTSRASSLRLLGPIYLPDDRTGRAADRHLDRFRPRPEVWYVDDPRSLRSDDRH